MIKILVDNINKLPSFENRLGIYIGIRTKKRGRMARKLAKLAKEEHEKAISPFSGLGKISAATRESVERNLELASLSKTNMTNLEVVQARIDRRAARAARKAEKRRKGRKVIDVASIKAERERKRALDVDLPVSYPEHRETQEFIIKRFLTLQNVELNSIFKDLSKSVFDYDNIKQPYYISVPHNLQIDGIMLHIEKLYNLGEKYSNTKDLEQSVIDEFKLLDNYQCDFENVNWWLSVCCPIQLQYECYNDWVLDVYLKYGMLKNPFKTLNVSRDAINKYNEDLINNAL